MAAIGIFPSFTRRAVNDQLQATAECRVLAQIKLGPTISFQGMAAGIGVSRPGG